MTQEQRELLDLLDRGERTRITDDDLAICPGLHWCPDWDFLPVCDDSPEKAGCNCAPASDGATDSMTCLRL